jgi:hypothetical protein
MYRNMVYITHVYTSVYIFVYTYACDFNVRFDADTAKSFFIHLHVSRYLLIEFDKVEENLTIALVDIIEMYAIIRFK